jgi:hypothetical protein
MLFTSDMPTYTQTKGRCAHYLLGNEPIFRLLAWLISQLLSTQRRRLVLGFQGAPFGAGRVLLCIKKLKVSKRENEGLAMECGREKRGCVGPCGRSLAALFAGSPDLVLL